MADLEPNGSAHISNALCSRVPRTCGTCRDTELVLAPRRRDIIRRIGDLWPLVCTCCVRLILRSTSTLSAPVCGERDHNCGLKSARLAEPTTTLRQRGEFRRRPTPRDTSTLAAEAVLHDRGGSLQPRCVPAKHQHRPPRQLFPADARALPGCAGGSPPASRREPALLNLRAQWVGHVQPPRACTSPPQQGRRREQGSDSARLSGSAAWSK